MTFTIASHGAREDKFQEGDMVTLIDIDDYTNDAVHQEFWAKYGRGPQHIEAVEEIPEWERRLPLHIPLHTQRVQIDGRLYHGAWFKPAERS